MISKKLRQTMAASMAVVMTVGLAACGGKEAKVEDNSQKNATNNSTEKAQSTPTPEPEKDPDYTEEGYYIRRDKNGNVVDLGGMTVTIRDWWTNGDNWPAAPVNNYDEAQQEYWAWAQETYNFTMKRETISDWGNVPADFVDYCTTGGDENNYVFTLRSDPAIIAAMKSGLVADITKLDGAIDLSAQKWNRTKVHELYTFPTGTFAMASGYPEARGMLFFNKRLLTEAGVDWHELYAKESDASWWTWDKLEEIMAKVQKDKDGDGINDVWGFAANWGNFFGEMIYSNGGSFIKMDASGKLVNNLESKETMEAINRGWQMRQKYGYEQPADGTWEYYKDAFNNGVYAFLPDDAYYAANLKAGCNDEWGGLCFPVGPSAGGKHMMSVSDNLYAIPGCYDADRQWKIAFAYDVFTDDIPGYEDYPYWRTQFEPNFEDAEAVDTSIALVISNAVVQYNQIVPGIDTGAALSWWSFSEDNTPAQVAESVRETWQAALDEFNK